MKKQDIMLADVVEFCSDGKAFNLSKAKSIADNIDKMICGSDYVPQASIEIVDSKMNIALEFDVGI